jgi:SAM-dependent methyltransferase
VAYLPHGKSLLFRFAHEARFQTALRLVDARPGQTILDYGCADGRLLRMLPDTVTKIGYDPIPQEFSPTLTDIQFTTTTTTLANSSCDAITLCEVLEHVSPSEAQRILIECSRLLRHQAKLIISVPIEVGLSSLVKSLARLIKVRPLEKNMTLLNVLRSACYLPVKREIDSYNEIGAVYGHTGFDYRRLTFPGFTISRRVYSPLPFGPVLNSQVFYLASTP